MVSEPSFVDNVCDLALGPQQTKRFLVGSPVVQSTYDQSSPELTFALILCRVAIGGTVIYKMYRCIHNDYVIVHLFAILFVILLPLFIVQLHKQLYINENDIIDKNVLLAIYQYCPLHLSAHAMEASKVHDSLQLTTY